MVRSREPFWWSLFAVGGVISAFLLPVTIAITGIAIPAGTIRPDRLYTLLQHPAARLYLFLIIVFSLFHAAHRIRFTLVDLGLTWMRGRPGSLLYAAAVVASLIAGWLLFL